MGFLWPIGFESRQAPTATPSAPRSAFPVPVGSPRAMWAPSGKSCAKCTLDPLGAVVSGYFQAFSMHFQARFIVSRWVLGQFSEQSAW